MQTYLNHLTDPVDRLGRRTSAEIELEPLLRLGRGEGNRKIHMLFAASTTLTDPSLNGGFLISYNWPINSIIFAFRLVLITRCLRLNATLIIPTSSRITPFVGCPMRQVPASDQLFFTRTVYAPSHRLQWNLFNPIPVKHSQKSKKRRFFHWNKFSYGHSVKISAS